MTDSTHSVTESYFWLSFVDHDLSEGRRSLGATVVRARCPRTAVLETWRLGINPGGEVACIQFETAPQHLISFMLNQLRSRQDIVEAGVV